MVKDVLGDSLDVILRTFRTGPPGPELVDRRVNGSGGCGAMHLSGQSSGDIPSLVTRSGPTGGTAAAGFL
ncbi:hypothetical protein [Catenulispora pinisilvae]|uniref:hypothetical protein n=1 Tax=Catenulispora pinisilvae TaxID=2705253 RepID=UPI0018927440|nr:hypothetical protein [Catenulispora pinisilvae]